jgi:hypothetical protein
VVKIAQTVFRNVTPWIVVECRRATTAACFSTTATDILQLGRRSGVFRDERVREWGARRIAFDGHGLCRFRRRRRIVASQSPARTFDAAAVWFFGESALRQCAQHHHGDGDFHANSFKPAACQERPAAPCHYFFLPEPKLGCHPAVFWLGAAAIVLIFSFLGFRASRLPFCSPLAMRIPSCFHDDAV